MRLFELFDLGETEICGVMHYLLLRSPELRETLLTLINSKIPTVYLKSMAHFSCTREWSKTASEPSPANNSGRVDILLEVDNAIIGIEAKIQAYLSDDQPEKYIAAILTQAAALAKIRRDSPIYAVILLLLPETQIGAAEIMIKTNAHKFTGVSVCVVGWAALFDAWRLAPVTDNVARFVLYELQQCVLIETGANADFQRLMPLIRAPLSAAQHDAHYEFAYWLFSAFRGSRPRLPVKLMRQRNPNARTYVGYYFLSLEVDRVWGWFGFVAPQYADKAPNNPPTLVFGTDFDIPKLEGTVFRRIVAIPPDFYPKARCWWSVAVDKIQGCDNIDRWRDALHPLHEAADAESMNRPPERQTAN